MEKVNKATLRNIFLGLVLGLAWGTASATYHEGCTPGYWKNHLDSWVSYTSQDLVGNVFYLPYADLADDTLLQALRYGGGNELEGAAKILLRQAVAALLNASNPSVQYRFPINVVLYRTNKALASYDREIMIQQSAYFEAYNEIGCPLN